MDEYQFPRERMLKLLREHYKIKDEECWQAMNEVPRHASFPTR